jgi:hypothetical protein
MAEITTLITDVLQKKAEKNRNAPHKRKKRGQGAKELGGFSLVVFARHSVIAVADCEWIRLS